MENAFGILALRWQVLLGTMLQLPEACVCLHNIMRLRYPALQNVALDRETEDHDFVPCQWRQNVNMHDVGGDLRGRKPQ